MQKLIIDRSKWLRGDEKGTSYLLRSSDNKMCCLGFLCIALGAKEEDIRQVEMPDQMDRSIKIPDYLNHPFRTIGKFPRSAADLNDDRSIYDKERERKLIALFAEQNIQLEFVDRDATPENVEFAGEEHP